MGRTLLEAERLARKQDIDGVPKTGISAVAARAQFRKAADAHFAETRAAELLAFQLRIAALHAVEVEAFEAYRLGDAAAIAALNEFDREAGGAD